MKSIAATFVALVLSATALPQATTSRWQRVLTPSADHPTAEQCVVVDADLYAHAAPGLRDVRLVQDGVELPYAMDVSFDTRVGEAAPPPQDDRAVYDVVQVVPLLPSHPAGVARYALKEAPHDWHNEVLLSAHVPIERVRLVPAPRSPAMVDLRVSARMNLRDAEEMHATVTAQQPAAFFTVGANLQEEADVLVHVHMEEGEKAPATARSLVLEMRRREICYQPRSGSPIYLFSGDGGAQPARYDYATRFQPAADPVLAAMGPVRTNPVYHAAEKPAPLVRTSASLRVGVMALICVGSLLAVAFAVWELRRS